MIPYNLRCDTPFLLQKTVPKENKTMKNKKLFLPTVILAVAIVIIAVYSLVSSIAKKPAVTEGEFPFSITYELDGETVTLEDVYQVKYVPNDKDDNHKGRIYEGKRLSSGEDSATIILKQDENSRVELWFSLYADYLMGDPEYDYFADDTFGPKIFYYDENETEYQDQETLSAQGVKLIRFEYPTPIENSFVFSHLAYFTSTVVLPILFVAFLALIAMIIFVRKEKELKYRAVDVVSIVLNWVIGIVYMGFVTLLALFLDINGGGSELYYQIMYFIPAVSLLCVAASVALRRKGFGVKALVAELIGPVIFAVYLPSSKI
jgi:hypothetical protein